MRPHTTARFDVPGVTFVAGTGDYGAADPEYPAFSPNVVAVGGTSLNLNADNSYNSETGWGYNSASAGVFIGSGGGISLYEPEPAYQEGSSPREAGPRPTSPSSPTRPPGPGSPTRTTWAQQPVRGRRRDQPVGAGLGRLVALVNQGRAAAGEADLDSSSPTETQQALYSLPQSDYNMITSGSNGYTANAGYNLVTGLGTPVANLLVPDLVAYQGPGTTYAARPSAPCRMPRSSARGRVAAVPTICRSTYSTRSPCRAPGSVMTNGLVPPAPSARR